MPTPDDVNNAKPVNICLYLTLPLNTQNKVASFSFLRRTKSAIKTSLNCVATRISGNLFLEDDHYLVASNLTGSSNKGDIAIRLAVRDGLASAFRPRPVNFFEIGWGDLTHEAVGKINGSCDLFVIGGGGYVFLSSDGGVGKRLVADLEFLAKIGCPKVAYGIGLNRLMHEPVHDLLTLPAATGERVKAFAECFDLIGVRDQDTKQLFTQYSAKPVPTIGDPVLLFEGRGSGSGPRNRAATSKTLFAINLAAHGWRAITILKPFLPQFVRFIKAAVRKYEAELVYVRHHELETPVISFLRQKGLRFEVVDGDPESMIEHYGRADFVICQMLHSCIFAANAEVPFLNVAYDQKSVSFCELLEIPDCAVPHLQATSTMLEDRLDLLFARRSELLHNVRLRKSELRLETQRFLRHIAELA